MTQTPTRPAGSLSEPLDRTARTVIAVVVLGMITTVLDATIVSVATERLAAGFAVPLTTVQWVMTGYLLAFTAAIPVTGWAVDRYGARPVWLSAVGLFTAGSLLCGLAWSADSLIAFRVVQGIGAGMVSPVGITMVARAVGQHRMGRAMAVVGIPMMLGPILGPVVGGLLIDTVDWRWIFFLNLPIGLACLAWSLRVIVREPGQHRERLDVVGLALLSPGLVALVYGVTSVTGDGEVGADVIGGIGVGTALVAGFVVHALRAERPLVDLTHFRHRGFAAATAVQFLTVGVLTAASVNGLVGLKPTRGRLAQDALMRQQPVRIVADGVVTRSVRDTAAFFREAERVYRPLAMPPVGDLTRPGRKRLRVALNTTGLDRGANAEVTRLTEQTARLLEDLGHTVIEVPAPTPPTFADDFLLYWAALSLALLSGGRRQHGRTWNRSNHDSLTFGLARHARRNLHRLPRAIVRLRRSTHDAALFFEKYDVSLTPTLATPTPRIGHLDPTQDYETIIDRLQDWVTFTPLQNATGTPAISLPLATASTGLPQGMMFGSGWGHEAALLELAYELEQAQPWARIHE